MSAPLASLFDLTGRVGLVCGGSRGLGLQAAEALGEYGAVIALIARKEAELNDAVAHLAALGISAYPFIADLSSCDAADGIVKRIMAQFGRIDVLVNNAGATLGAPAEEYPHGGWNKVFNLNVTSLFMLTKAVAREAFLPQGKGAVINVASIGGQLGHHLWRGGTIDYNTAKGAIINMTRALGAEWGPKNIRVNALAPGLFVSRMTALTLIEHGARLIEQTPLGKLGNESDLKGSVLLLASDAGGHITGQVLVIDGGTSII
ncbi:MAG: short-chain dehydrogenase/reductase [Gammaproteobacteria bacterium]|jgi:NAD(P)-dependent dehydrogenase (short-subunit alcohol dehydrogenase family)|nr:short-chain dehydrogenase/reductase [Gammaproteobacteria bacterium]